jgi:hypothetical protein
MPTFETRGPIRATVAVVVGDIRIDAGERTMTVVDVRPSDPTDKEDVLAAEQTRVEYRGGQLLVKTPKPRSWSIRSHGGSVDVAIELPAGSELHLTGQMAELACDGELGDCRVKNGIGQIRLGTVGALNVKTGSGDIDVARAGGHADIVAGSGDVRVGELAADATIKNSNGDTWVGVAHGELRLSAANGSLAVDHAHANVVAKAANGDVRAGDVVRGTVVLETQVGDVEVGIREGTAAFVDVSATAGRVHNGLQATENPGPSAETVEVRARTTLGNVVVGRAA